MKQLLTDAIVPEVIPPTPDFWLLLGIIAGVLAIAAVLIVVLVKRKKKKNQNNQ